MMDGSRLECEGIVGDGCGGGRLFVVEDGVLYAHDRVTDENTVLLENIKDAKKLSKKGCIITIECEDESIEFDLSSFGVKKTSRLI
ncbi:MAG: thiamine biosynthesis protein ThiF [Campylobacterales bacterium]|nr:thiamine biosynthesis protein ThiF [Campylobacterales bacterium]